MTFSAMSHTLASESDRSFSVSPGQSPTNVDPTSVHMIPQSPENPKSRAQPRRTVSPIALAQRNRRHPLSQPPINATQTSAMDVTSSVASLDSPVVQTVQARRFSFPAYNANADDLITSPLMLSEKSVPVTPNMKSSPVSLKASLLSNHSAPWESGDQTWRALLGQTVDVEWLGAVSVARFMAEVWKRGGPNVVSDRSLWGSVLNSLAQPTQGGLRRAPLPHQTAEVTLALQALYNVAIRPNEATIFSGFLSSMSTMDAVEGTVDTDNNQVYGAWTPTKGVAEVDLSQWTTLTPGLEWPSLSTTLSSGPGLTPRGPFSPTLGLPPIHLLDPSDSPSRPDSPGRTEGDGIQAIDEILAQLEDNEVMRENEVGLSPPEKNLDIKEPSSGSGTTSRSESVATPSDNAPPSESPFASAASHFSSTPSNPDTAVVPDQPPPPCAQTAPPQAEESSRTRLPPSMQLDLPPVPYIPPPPMCMFFSPAFRDLQQGKVGVWKGDLNIQGRGGGTFSILIVGEQGSDNLWESHLWGDTLSYPPGPALTESCTATMIPVSTLAREGLLPVTMGMVLCNGDNIDEYVSMVQGLHAEGVAFHLPGSPLPIVFLPAKFDSADPLQRLGVAYMTKGGVPPPNFKPTPTTTVTTASPEATESSNDKGRKTRRRRKSTAVTKAQTDPAAFAKVHARRKSTPGRAKPPSLAAMTEVKN